LRRALLLQGLPNKVITVYNTDVQEGDKMTLKNIFSKKKHKVGESFIITNKRTGQQVEATVVRDYGDVESGLPAWRDYYQVEYQEPNSTPEEK